MVDDTSRPATSSIQRPPPRRPEWTRIVLALALAGIVGGVAGWLSHAAGNNLPAAVLTGGGAFAGTLGLLLAIARHADAG